MNIDSFRRLVAGRTQLRAAAPIEQASITDAIIHMPSPRLAQIGDERVKALTTAAIALGGGILMMGLSPMALEITGTRFCARCDLRLTNAPEHLTVLIEGRIDDLGRVDPDAAVLIG